MKKSIAVFITFITMASSVFAFDIGKRFFEIHLNDSFKFTNNVFALDDVLKETFVIDLNKINSNLSSGGMDVTTTFTPVYGFNVDFRKGSAGLDYLMDVRGNLNFAKRIFEFLANGNTLNETFQASVGATFDSFAVVKSSAGFKIKDAEILFSPSVFIPLLHVEVSKCVGKVENNPDGTFKVSADVVADLYSCVDLSIIDNLYSNALLSSDSVMDSFNGLGFDFGLQVKYPLFKGLKLIGDLQCPVIPGKLVSKKEFDVSANYSFNAGDLLNKQTPSASGNQNPEGGTSSEPFKVDQKNAVAVDKIINRPLVFMAGAEYTPFGNWLVLEGALGCGFRYPFTETCKFYMQYNLAASVNAWHMFACKVKTSYESEIFSNELGIVINLRVLEIDEGVSVSGTEFLGSFNGSGFGAYLNVCMGF